jgi:hypothetical protein
MRTAVAMDASETGIGVPACVTFEQCDLLPIPPANAVI